MRRVIVAAAIAMTQMCVAEIALAQSCACPRPTLEDLLQSDKDLAIFTARVVSIQGKPAVTRLEIGEIIRGRAPRVIEMTGVTPEDNACGIDFRPGEVRTMAAYMKDGRWYTDMCVMPRL
jgi:hypothetical protein